MAQEGIQIQVLLPVRFHRIIALTDIFRLLPGDAVLFGILDGDTRSLIGVEHRCLVVRIGVRFYQITAGQGISAIIGRTHLLDIHAVLTHLDLVA